MRAAPVVADILRAAPGLVDAQVFTVRVADISKRLPALVVLAQGGRVTDERFGFAASVTVDAYDTEPAAAEHLAWVARGALLAAAARTVGAVRTSSPPQIVPGEGTPGLARCLAVYTVQLAL